MKKEPEEIFGSHKEYIQALIRYSHPRHKEAMELRAERIKKNNLVIALEQNGELNMFQI